MSWLITGSEKTPVDPQFGSVSLLLHGNGTNNSTTIVDSSPTPKTITVNGSAKISTAQSKFGGSSITFNGSSDYITSSASTAFEFGTGDFTIETWVYVNSLSAVNGIYYYGSGNTNRLQLLIQTNGLFSFYSEIGGGYVDASSSASAISTTTWIHVAGTRAGNTWRCFVNGSLAGTATGSFTMPSSQTPNIGYAITGGTNRYFNGYIDDLRITKGVARYTANFTPPTAPFPDI